MTTWPTVVVATPAHSGVGDLLTYRCDRPLAPGALVRVPLGAREVLGIVWACPDAPPDGLSPDQTRSVAAVLDGLAPLGQGWRALTAFAARYYQRGLGEVALAALPPPLRDLSPEQLARRLKRAPAAPAAAQAGDTALPLSDEQAAALDSMAGATARWPPAKRSGRPTSPARCCGAAPMGNCSGPFFMTAAPWSLATAHGHTARPTGCPATTPGP